jgi:predicted  nucleic acid-binding Zn-ribbon protein
MPKSNNSTAVKCLKCGKTFTVNAETLRCPNPACYNHKYMPNKATVGRRPNKKNNKKPKPPTQPINQEQKAVRAMRSQASRATATRTMRQSSAMKAISSAGSRGINTQTVAMKTNPMRAHLMTLLSPSTMESTGGVALNVDDVTRAKLALGATTRFTINDPANSVVKIALLPSPVVIAIVQGTDTTTFGMAQTINLGNNLTAIIGNRASQYGEFTDRYDYTASVEYTKYRTTLLSGEYQWIGPALNSNGVAETAHLTYADEFESYTPSQNSECIYSRLSEGFSVFGKHTAPIYDFMNIDISDNGDETGELVNNNHTAQNAIASHLFTLFNEGSNVRAGTAPGKTATQSTSQYATTFLQGMFANASTSVLSAWILAWLNEIDQKWGLYQDVNKNFTAQHTASIVIHLPGIPTDPPTSKIATAINGVAAVEPSNTTTFTPATFAAHLYNIIGSGTSPLVAAMANNLNVAGIVLTDTCLAFPAEFNITFSFRFAALNQQRGKSIQDSAHPRQSLNLLAESISVPGFLLDSHFQIPVTLMSANSIQMQIMHRVNVEMVANDVSAFTEVIKERADEKRNGGINKPQWQKLNSVISRIPAALNAGNQAKELGGRGILGDIAGILGPLVNSIIPGSEPFSSAVISGIHALNL